MVYVYRSITRSFINFFVNFITILLFFIIIKPSLLSNVGYSIIGFILLAVILVPIGIMISIFCLRYRDILSHYYEFYAGHVFFDPSFLGTIIDAHQTVFYKFQPILLLNQACKRANNFHDFRLLYVVNVGVNSWIIPMDHLLDNLR